MVALEAVKASNARLSSLPAGFVALFVGGTSGIGESTLKLLCRHAIAPRIYLVGRNEQSARRIISQIEKDQPNGTYNFIQKDVTLLKNVDEVCEEIKSKEPKLNLLFMTAGTLSMKGRDETSEGLDKKLVANYYARLRFTTQLLPLLRAASPQLSRVVSVYAPGEESASIDLTDLDLKSNFSLRNAAAHAVTMTDFAFEEVAKQNPTVSFVHAFPGFVKTGFLKEFNVLVRAAGNAMLTLLAPWRIQIEESGERHLFAATSGRYPARDGREESVGLEGDMGVMKGSDGTEASGAYLLGADGEFRANEKVLDELRRKGAGGKVWDHTMEMFEKVRSQGRE